MANMKFPWSIGFLIIFARTTASFDCQNTVMDIALVIPSRDSVGKTNHAAMLRSVKNLIEQFSVLEGRSHVAIIQFAKKAVVSVPTSDLSSPQMLNEAIRAVQNEPKDLGQDINIYKALGKVAKNIFKEDNDSRPSSIDLVILLINKPADDEDRRTVIQDLEGRGIYRVTVGIGNDIQKEQLRNITGRSQGVLQFESFVDLEANVNDIHNTTCSMLNCEDPPLDICLVIDQTESVRQPNYIIMMNAAIDFVNFFTVDVNKTRFAIVTFAEYSTVRVNFTDAEYQSRANLSNFLNGMKNDTLGRPTRTDRALESALQVLKESKGDRQGVLLVLTDGKTNKHSRDLGEVMNETRTMEKEIHRIAVGIGPKIRPKQLRQIAGPHNEDGVVSVTDFIELSRKIRRLREVTCSINGRYSEWNSWSACSASCDGGVRWHNRTCTRPPPRHAGKDCVGPSLESQACNTMECGNDGNYTDWSVWSVCSKNCDGIQVRYRLCTRPPPTGLGKNCTGNAIETRSCGNACPVLPPCKSGIDLGLLIDGSESILEKNLRLLLRKFLPTFLKKQFKKGTIRKDATRVGVVKFDTRPEVLLDFKDKLSYRRKKLVKMLKETSTNVVYETRIDRGLKEVRRKLFSKRGGDRKNSPNVLVLFTDGKPFPPDKVEPFNQTLPPLRKNKKVHMVFVAYGPPDKVNYTNLERIAAPDKVIRLPGTTKEFRKQNTLLELRKAVCEINGRYTPWGYWSTCSHTCGSAVQIRSRSCTAPPQRRGGKDCSRFGPSNEIRPCNETACSSDIFNGTFIRVNSME